MRFQGLGYGAEVSRFRIWGFASRFQGLGYGFQFYDFRFSNHPLVAAVHLHQVGARIQALRFRIGS